MKDIFGNNNYRFGVESFLLMYLNQYQLILGADLENYAQSQELFNEDNPCNIYFVLRRPKVTVYPNSFIINGNKLNFSYLFTLKKKTEL